jgi:hypothetical protein
MQTQRNRSIRICFTGLATVGALSLGACGASDAADTATPDAVNDTVTAGEAPTASTPEPSNSEPDAPDAPDDVDDATVADEVAPAAGGEDQRASVMIDGAAIKLTDGTCIALIFGTEQIIQGFFTGADGSVLEVTWASETIDEAAITYTDGAESFQWAAGSKYAGSGDLDVVLGDGGTATVSGMAIDLYATDSAPVDVVVDMQCQDGV